MSDEAAKIRPEAPQLMAIRTRAAWPSRVDYMKVATAKAARLMASFAEGLASGLSGLPQALMYGQEKRRKEAEEDRKDIYRKDIAGLSSADGPFDSEAAARIALKHGDIDSALEYRRMAAEAKARTAAGERQKGLDEISCRGSFPAACHRG